MTAGAVPAAAAAHAQQFAGATHAAALPTGLQGAIDRTLVRRPESSPGGVTVRWGSAGLVSFSVTGGAATGRPAATPSAAAELTPSTLQRAGHTKVRLDPGAFVFASTGTSEALGSGASANYRLTNRGVEQRFTLTERPAGSSGAVVLSQRLGGSLHAVQGNSGQIRFRGARGAELTYLGLKVTDARGRTVPSQLGLARGSLRIRIDDRRAVYPLSVNPTVLAAPSLAATLTNSGSEHLGYSIAVAADGQTAAVGVPNDNEILVYTGSGTSWSSTPAATLTASGTSLLGASVGISADGRTIVAGAPFTNFSRGDVVLFTQQPTCNSSVCDTWTWPSSPTATFTDPGAGSGDQFGQAVAIAADGHSFVAGAPGESSGAGAAFLYANSGGGWSNTPSATFAGSSSDNLGDAVAISADGQTVVAGAPTTSSSAGEAALYTYSGSAWPSTPTAVFTGSGAEKLGSAVAVSADGQTVATGAPAASTSSGQVSIYTNTGSGWSNTPSATFNGSGAEQLGNSVAVAADGETVVIGAPANSSDNGQVVVYSKASGSWPIQPTYTYAGSAGEELGYSVSVSADGQTIAAGAPVAGSSSGAANIYATSVPGFQPSATWTSAGSGSNDELGNSVAISADGHTAVIGEPGATGSDSAASGGEVLIFKQSGGTWSSTATKTYTGSGGEFLGVSVAVSADGQTVVAGADRYTSNEGTVNVYAQSSGAWPSTATKSFTGAATNDELGSSVGVSGDGQTVVAGEPGAGSNAGAVLVYTQSAGSWASPSTSTLTASGTEGLGSAVAIAGDGRTIIAGAPFSTETVVGNTTQSSAGDVEIYSDSGGSWSDVLSQPSEYVAELGYSVAISANGQEAVAGGPVGSFLNPTSSTEANGMLMSITYEKYSQSQTGYAAYWEFSNNTGDELGSAVGISADGHTIVANAPGGDSGNGYVSVLQPTAQGTLPNTIPATFEGSLGGSLNGSVAVSGDGQTVLAGTPNASGDDGRAAMYTPLNATVTAASSASIAYSPTAHNTLLAATLTSGGTAVSGASVNFTLEAADGSTVGTPLAATTNGSGDASVSYGIPAGTAPGTYTIVASYAGDGQTHAASSDDTHALTIAKATQSVSFTSAAPAGASVGSTYAASGSATSGLPVTVAIDAGLTTNGACTVSGSSVTFVHVGTCGLDASQAGNADYDAASAPTPQSFTVGAGSQAISFTSTPPTNATVGGATYVPSATGGGSGLPVTFTVAAATTNGSCTLSSGTVSFVHAGSCVIDADQAASADYTAAATVSQTLSIGKGAQTIRFTSQPPSQATVGGAGYAVSTTIGDSAEPVTLSIDPATTNGSCTLSGTEVTFVAAGTCVVDANEAGDADYSAAVTVQQSFSVSAAQSTQSPPATQSSPTTQSTQSPPATPLPSTPVCSTGQISTALSGLFGSVTGKSATTVALHKAGGIALKFNAPCGGRLVLGWYATVKVGRKRVKQLVAGATTGFTAAGSGTVKVRLIARGRRLFDTGRRLQITQVAAFTPAGGTATDRTRSVTLKR